MEKEVKMKKFGKLNLLALVILLMMALVFVGINSLEAQKGGKKPDKKPKPGPEWTWNVTIPGIQAIDQDYKPYNLYGLPYPDSNTYKDENDRVYVIVEKKKGGKEYLLRLFIYHSVYEGICEDLSYPHQIGFQKLDLVNVPHSGEGYWAKTDEFPCYFPNYKVYDRECYPEGVQPVDFWLGDEKPDDHRIGRVPGCMKDFLENYPHPYCDINCDIYENTEEPSCETICPNCVYRNIDIFITVDQDIEKMGVGEIAHPTAEVWIEVENNYDIQTGLEDWHNISGLLRPDDSTGCITITRSARDTWEIIVDTRVDPLFTFIEIWHERWEYKIPYWTHTPFKFITTWTRQPTPDTTAPAEQP